MAQAMHSLAVRPSSLTGSTSTASLTGIEPATSSLGKSRSSIELQRHGAHDGSRTRCVPPYRGGALPDEHHGHVKRPELDLNQRPPPPQGGVLPLNYQDMAQTTRLERATRCFEGNHSSIELRLHGAAYGT